MEIEIAGRSLNAVHIWGWEIPVYLFLGGLTAGTMIVTALIQRRVPLNSQSRWMRAMPLIAPLVLSAGMGALFLDLTSRTHVYRFYTAFRITSPMSWGSWILLLIYPATILLGLVRLNDRELSWLPRLVQRLAEKARPSSQAIATANLLLGIALGTYTGILLATLTAREVWNSALLGPLFLVSGLSTGAALLMLFPITAEEHEAVRHFDLLAITGEVVLLTLFFIHLVANGSGGRSAAGLFFGGPYTAPFWALVVIAGLAVPLMLEIAEKRFGLRSTVMTSLLLLGGGFALRWILVAAGQSQVM